MVSVVLRYAFPKHIQGGFVGVNIFFVVSGYLISTIIFAGLQKRRFSFVDLYARRIKRIFPALLLVLFTIVLIGWACTGEPATGKPSSTPLPASLETADVGSSRLPRKFRRGAESIF